MEIYLLMEVYDTRAGPRADRLCAAYRDRDKAVGALAFSVASDIATFVADKDEEEDPPYDDLVKWSGNDRAHYSFKTADGVFGYYIDVVELR